MQTDYAFASSTDLIEKLKNDGVKVIRVTYPDMRAIPDLSTLTPVPWEEGTMQCIADVYDGTEPVAISSRHLLKKAESMIYNALKLKPMTAHELEFFLLEKTEKGWQRYSDHPSMVYTVGLRSDERGVIRTMLQAGETMGLGLTAGNHEFAGGQFEINMVHGYALEAADRAFRFKNMVKEVAASHQLLATFMGKPFNNVTGSGYHLHLSLVDDQEANRFYDRKQPDGLSEIMKYFIGGIIAHAPALMAFYWKLDPGQEVVGNAASGDASSISLPRSLEQSLTYLRQDEILCDLIGKPLVNAYTTMKEAELERFRTYVTDWEFNEYAFHL